MIVITALLPLPGVLFANLVGFGLTFSGGGGAVLVLWIVATVALALWFPNGWTDNLSFALTLLAMTLVSPIAPILGIDGFLGVIVGLVVFLGGWLFLSLNLPIWLDDQPFGQKTQRFRATATVDPAALQEAMFLRPNAQCGLYACGSPNKKGLFEVSSIGIQGLDDTLANQPMEISFLARVIKREENAQITQFFTRDEPVTSSTTHETITPTKSGASYKKKEVHDHFTWYAALGFWLTDYERDHFTATLDFLREDPPRALKLQSQDSLLFYLAHRFADKFPGEPRQGD
jgi:hypothetical protein